MPGWHHRSAELVKLCQRLVDLDSRLPAILNGERKPQSPQEQVELAKLCLLYKQRPAAAARLYGDAFDALFKI